MKLHWQTAEFGPPIRTSITLKEGRLLKELARDRDVLEIGSAFGYSTIVMAQVARHVTAIDPHQEMNTWGPFNGALEAYGVSDRVEVLRHYDTQILPELTQKFDLVFVDGDHRETAVRFDWEWAPKLIRPGGLIAFHDYGEDSQPDVALVLPAPWILVDTLAVYAS